MFRLLLSLAFYLIVGVPLVVFFAIFTDDTLDEVAESFLRDVVLDGVREALELKGRG